MRRHARHRTLIALAAAVAAAVGASGPVGAADDDHGHAAAPASPAASAPAAKDTKHDDHAAPASVPAAEAVQMLADGNARFVAGSSARPNLGQDRLCDTFANGQHPYAAVLACADSRVPVEHVLDAGIGDLFVVRVAGNVADVDEIGTLEYGVEHLGINAILVMGHVKCGAVTAVVDHAHVTPNIAKLVDNIEPAAAAARKQFPQLGGARLVSQAIRLNIRKSMDDLVANSDVIRQRVKDGKLKIVGGVYDLHTGEVDWIASTNDGTPTIEPSRSISRDLLKDEDRPAKSTPRPEPKSAGHAKHAAASDKGHKRDVASSHGDDDDDHDVKHKKSDKSHGGGAADDDAKAAAAKVLAPPPERKENFLALGGLLAGSSIATGFVLHFVGRRPK